MVKRPFTKTFYSILLLCVTSTVICEFGQVIPNIQIAYEGTNLTIFCNSSTAPKWFKNGKQKGSTKGGPFYLFFTDVNGTDSGDYFCQGTYANNDIFNVSSRLFVGGENK